MLRQLLPQRIKDSLKVLLGRAVARDPEGSGRFSCPVCDAADVPMLPLPFYYLREMDKNQYVHSLFLGETLNLEHYSCASCGASDRDRLYALYFRQALMA